MKILFSDRLEAGYLLGRKLQALQPLGDCLVVGIAPAGIIVASQVAQQLDAPLDLVMVRSLPVPGHEHISMGALAVPYTRILDPEVTSRLRISPDVIDAVGDAVEAQAIEQEREFRTLCPEQEIGGRTVLLVDEGIASGFSMMAACAALKRRGAKKLQIAAPIASPKAIERLGGVSLGAVVLATPDPFPGIAACYERLPEATTEEVKSVLRQAQNRSASNG
jgi:putative phosphoribosyl transferase